MSNVPVIVREEDKAATAALLGYHDWADANDYRLTGRQDRTVEATVQAFARHRIAATSTLQDQVEALEWFSSQHRLSIEFYSPMYGDDDDQSEEWRVHKESGPINDREWDVVGTGATAAIAIVSARAALTQKDISR